MATFDQHVTSLFRERLRDLQSRAATVDPFAGAILQHLCNHADTMPDARAYDLWLAIVEEMALPRFMKD